jgi:predicted outer membrane protein
MRRIHTLIGGAALLFLGGTAFAQTEPKPADTAGQKEMDQKKADQKADKLNSFDKQFASKAAGSGMTEVKLSEIALDRGTDAIRPIAERMRKDHGEANSQLKSLAEEKGLTLPAEIPADKKQTIDRLSKLNGADFDRAYLETLMQSHHKSLELFIDEMKKGGDLEMLAFAARITPIVIQHSALLHANTERQGVSGHDDANQADDKNVAPSIPVPPSAGAPPVPTEPQPVENKKADDKKADDKQPSGY